MSRIRGNISERLAKAKARIIFNKYKDEEERTSFLKSRYNYLVKLSAVIYILISSIILLDLFLPSNLVNDKISDARKSKVSSVGRRGSHSDIYWKVRFENSRSMEMEYSKYLHNPKPGDEVIIEFSVLLNQPISIYNVKWGEKVSVVSSVFSGLRLVIYCITLFLSILFLILSKRAYQILASATFGFITVTLIFILLTMFTK